MAIIGTLATIVIASLGDARDNAKEAAVIAELRSLQTEIEVQTGGTGDYTSVCGADTNSLNSIYSKYHNSITSKGWVLSGCYDHSVFMWHPSATDSDYRINYVKANSSDNYCVVSTSDGLAYANDYGGVCSGDYCGTTTGSCGENG